MGTTVAQVSSVYIRLHPEEKELLRLNADIQGLSVFRLHSAELPELPFAEISGGERTSTPDFPHNQRYAVPRKI
jgi:hypothetical protein